jgi:hypothetical protein
VATHPTPIRINELNANNPVYQDMTGDTDDWIELYNMSDTALDLGGYFLSDDVDERFTTELPDGTQTPATLPDGAIIPPGGVLLLYADAEPNQTQINVEHQIAWIHLGFKLSSQGEGVWLSNPDGYLIDSVEYRITPPNQAGTQWTSLARFPDGTGAFRWCSEASPDALNTGTCQGENL